MQQLATTEIQTNLQDTIRWLTEEGIQVTPEVEIGLVAAATEAMRAKARVLLASIPVSGFKGEMVIVPSPSVILCKPPKYPLSKPIPMPVAYCRDIYPEPYSYMFPEEGQRQDDDYWG